MKINTIIGIGLGGAVVFAIAKAMQNQSINRQIHIGQTQSANNSGYVIYNQDYYKIEEILQQTADLDLTAYEAQQEIAANSRTGQTIQLAIGQIDRLRNTNLAQV